MTIDESNPGGSYVASNFSLDEYLKKYRRLGNHVKRYMFARNYCDMGTVIDFGCGYGVGANLLEGRYSKYIGVDSDVEAIQYAKKTISEVKHNTNFLSPEELENSNGSDIVNLVTCFEVFEHVANPRSLMRKLVSLVSNSGKIILSTPNGLSSAGRRDLFRSPYHIHEYEPIEFAEILSEFGHVTMYAENRFDKADVLLLSRRLKHHTDRSVRISTTASIPVATSIIFNLFDRFLNGSFFWTIRPTNTSREQERLASSTLIAVVEPY